MIAAPDPKPMRLVMPDTPHNCHAINMRMIDNRRGELFIDGLVDARFVPVPPLCTEPELEFIPRVADGADGGQTA